MANKIDALVWKNKRTSASRTERIVRPSELSHTPHRIERPDEMEGKVKPIYVWRDRSNNPEWPFDSQNRAEIVQWIKDEFGPGKYRVYKIGGGEIIDYLPKTEDEPGFQWIQ